MGKLMGRPPKAIKQEKFVGFFVTNAQHFVIRQKAEEARVNISDYLRQTAVYGYVKQRWTPVERECFLQWVGVANGVNQVVKVARQEGADAAILHFVACRDTIDAILKRLTHDK
jgi:hypothetical protein